MSGHEIYTLIAAIILTTLGFLAGYLTCRDSYRTAAVKHKVAKWVVDDTGYASFEWLNKESADNP